MEPKGDDMTIPHKKATLALLVRNGHVLLGLKIRKGADIGEGTLNGPGGKVNEGETYEENVVQEVQDEVGLDIPAAALADAKRAIVTFHNGTASRWEVHVYLVSEFLGEPTNSEEMVCPSTGWRYPIDNLPFEAMLPADREWIPKVLAGEQFTADMYLNDASSAFISSTYINW